jgi:hypothetical protein
VQSSPTILGPIISFTFLTAFNTPLPPNLCPPSLNSNASLPPVEAPDGTPEVNTPLFVTQSTSRVGFPLESSISLAFIALIIIYIYTHELLPLLLAHKQLQFV